MAEGITNARLLINNDKPTQINHIWSYSGTAVQETVTASVAYNCIGFLVAASYSQTNTDANIKIFVQAGTSSAIVGRSGTNTMGNYRTASASATSITITRATAANSQSVIRNIWAVTA